jgi:hypothetical protein
MRGHLARVAVQLGEVLEGVRPAQLARGDQAHKHIAYVGAVRSFVEEGIAPVTDRLFQGLFANVIVQRSPGHAQEQRQFLPVPKQVGDGFPQP